MAKMSDVAKLANVSKATVSRVLQHPETVKEQTRKKVLHAIEQLNYQPNLLARQFRRTETKTILVVVPTIMNNVFPQIIGGIDAAANEHGFKVLLGNTNRDPEKTSIFINELKQKQVDGMILLTIPLEEKVINEVAAKYPVVLTSDYNEGLNIPTVAIDNISCGREATEHLIKLGHKRIAHITGPLEISISRDRLKGYHQAVLQHEVDLDSLLVQEGDYSFESGYNQMLKLLAIENPPTAVFAGNDVMAMGVVKAAKSQGLKVPEDIAVVGFDNIKFSEIFEPALTTIEQPFFEMGKRSMELLLQQINGEKLTRLKHVLNARLTIRDSCGSKKATVIEK